MGLILLVALLATLPNWLYGFNSRGHDSTWHAQWAYHFSNQFLQGELYPRWLMDMNGGLGSPAFFYYPPVPFWITSVVRLLCPGESSIWQLLGYSATLGMLASGWAAFIFLRCLVRSKFAACLGACVYLIMPYHSAVDLYQRCAFAEFWSFIWLPLILFFVLRIQEGQAKAWLGLAFSYALLVMTHLPTTLIFSCLPIAMSWFTSPADRRKQVLARTIAGIILGTAISAVYVLPALTMQSHVQIEALKSGGLDFKNNFLAGEWFSRDLASFSSMRNTLCWQTLSVTAAGFIGWALSVREKCAFPSLVPLTSS